MRLSGPIDAPESKAIYEVAPVDQVARHKRQPVLVRISALVGPSPVAAAPVRPEPE
jgi:hypothetical protein